jgi:hypothetical protein
LRAANHGRWTHGLLLIAIGEWLSLAPRTLHLAP